MTRLEFTAMLGDRRELYLDLLTSKQHADISLLTEDGRETRAHQVILSAASQTLRNILMELSQQDTAITLVGLSYEELGEVLGLIYTGELSCDPANVERFREIARHLGLGETSVSSNHHLPPSNEIKQEDEEKEEDEMFNLEELLDDEDFIRNVVVEAESEKEDNRLEVKEEPLEDELVVNDAEDPDPAINRKVVQMKTEDSSELSTKTRHRCDICDKRFSKKSHLKEHILIHIGLKPFCCDKCGWSFRRADKMAGTGQAQGTGRDVTTWTDRPLTPPPTP